MVMLHGGSCSAASVLCVSLVAAFNRRLQLHVAQMTHLTILQFILKMELNTLPMSVTYLGSNNSGIINIIFKAVMYAFAQKDETWVKCYLLHLLC